MKDLRRNIENLKDSINILEEEKYKEIFSGILNVLDDLSDKFEEMAVKQEYLEENVQYMDEDLTDLQEELFEEVSFEDLNNLEEEYIEIKCDNCNKPLFVEKAVVDTDKTIPCPFCNNSAK